MASRNATQTNSFDYYKNKNNRTLLSMTPRRSFHVTSNKNYSNNKHKIGYASESNAYIQQNDTCSSSEMSDFLTQMKPNKNNSDHLIETKQKETNQNKNKTTHNISYISIGHDTQLQTDSEILAITKNANISCTNNIGLTIERFTKLLDKQPKRLHLTFHGEYDTNTNTSIVKFDCIPMLPALLTNNKSFLYKNRTQKYYKHYIAAIARIFEQELITFVSQPVNQITNEPCSRYTCIGSEGIFDTVPKLKQLLKNIAETRFQCPYVNYRNRKFLGIWYGVWKQDAQTGQTNMTQQPNKWLLDQYKLSNICSNRQIDAIVRLIEKQYKRIAANNPTLMNINTNYQMYSWCIMNHAINQVIPNQVWAWLNSNESDVDMPGMDDIDGNANGVMNDELYSCFSRTFELTISPVQQQSDGNTLKTRSTVSEQKILEQRICAIMEEIQKNIRQDEITSNGLEYISDRLAAPLLNYKILRFSNETAVSCVRTKIIANMQRKYKNKYVIKFNKLSTASAPSYCLTGYIPLHDQRAYVLDMKKGTDEISTIIREKLISRKKCKIKLLLLLGCHSYKLAQIFAPYVENIICVHPHTEIDDNICVKFSKYFYNQLAEIDDNKTKLKYVVMTAFNNAMNKLHKSYGINTACQFHQDNNHSDIDKSAPILMVVRIDKDKHYELMQYVNHRLMDEKNNFGIDSQKHISNSNNVFADDISEPFSLLRRSSRGGQNMPDDVEYGQICDTNNNCNRKSMSLDSSSVSLKQCFDDTLDEFEDSAMIDIESSEYGVSWEYNETKDNLNFSYSIVKCDNEKIKKRVLQILKDKKHQEMIAVNRKFTNTKNIYPNKSTFLTETEDDVNYVNLRWDVTDVPKCECRMSVPHRVEDELVLLINGKHIDRNIKLPTIKPPLKRSLSVPNICRYNAIKLMDYGCDLTALPDNESLDIKTHELHDSSSMDSNDTETEYSHSYSGN